MDTRITQSSFRSVYLSIALILLFVVCSIFATSRFFVLPKITEERASSVLSIIRAQQYNILLNNTRPLRDELIQQGIISDDPAFQHYLARDAEGEKRIEKFLHRCKFYSPNICLARDESLFLLGDNSRGSLSAANFQYATFLKVDLQDPPFFFIAVEALVLTMICLCFALLIYGIHKKEKILLAKLALVLDSFDSVGSLFSTSNGQDEFEVISKNIDQLSTSLKEKTLKISEYKESFERKTKLEQLGLTVSQVGHDLRAPLSEAKNFIDALPLLIDRAPREELQKSLLSVSKRLGSGVDSLDKALRFTEVQATPKEDIFLLELVGEVISRVRLNPKMAEIKITVDRGKFDEVVIRGERSEIESVVFNLIQNSWEERRDANIRIAIESLDSGRVRIFFRDDGTGIPDELLEKVFEPLVTFKNNGTGIGLYSCRETLLRHSGTIRANSSRNGAEFEIVMPFRESPCMN